MLQAPPPSVCASHQAPYHPPDLLLPQSQQLHVLQLLQHLLAAVQLHRSLHCHVGVHMPLGGGLIS